MQANKGSRVDVVDLKALMLKKVGPERFKRYFYCLDRFINKKLSKLDFHRSCFQILGKENLPLHNQMMNAILKNSCSAKSPPPVAQTGPANSVIAAGKSSTSRENGHAHGGFVAHNQSSNLPLMANGSVLPTSPKKVRSAVRERKMRDWSGVLGPNGRTESISHQSTATEDSNAKISENGELMHSGYYEMDDGHLSFLKNPLVAPLGIPFCPASVGGTRKSLPSANIDNFVGSAESGVLPGSEMLRQRMEQIASACGLAGGVSMECANSLKNMMDVYLKGLIKPCVRSDGDGPSTGPLKNAFQRHQMVNKLRNGLWPSNHVRDQSFAGAMEGQRANYSVTLQDFKVAMELQPRKLGEDWPLLMEKISMRGFEL